MKDLILPLKKRFSCCTIERNGALWAQGPDMERFDCVIVGTGPAGLGAAFHLSHARPDMHILVIDREGMCTGGLRNDCKMNFTYPIGFPIEYWQKETAENLILLSQEYLPAKILETRNIDVYRRRAQRLGVELVEIRQSHLGTDGGILLIRDLMDELSGRGISISLKETMEDIREEDSYILTDRREIGYRKLIIAPGRKGFSFLQRIMDKLAIVYVDNVVDIGIRIETREDYYPIVRDYYDPKFLFPDKVRTFCTNSGKAYVVKEKYKSGSGKSYFSVNGHAFSSRGRNNGLVNFALLKTVGLTQPLASGQEYAQVLGQLVTLMGGGRPIMQRVGDFRLGKRSKLESFTGDLYDFEPTLKECTPGDISLAIPARILRAIWKSMKQLDTIIPGVMHPSTIMYYPEIKLYANKPQFIDSYFQAKENIYMIGDGAGTSRGITAAWASGIRAAQGILGK
jgi:uncharacterized FAD-dependent dehydrogenase